MRAALVLAIALAASVPAGVAHAETPKEVAARIFHDAERAFAAGDHRRAAVLFEEAHTTHPHPSALFNAAHAHARAGNRVRAATLYARLLRDAPTSSDAAEARAALDALTKALGRIQVERGRDVATRVTVDGAAADEDAVTYVEPGVHLVQGSVRGVTVRKDVDVAAGAIATITLEAALPNDAPAPPPPAAATHAPATAPAGKADVTTAPRKKPLAPIWVIVGAGTTLVAGGVTLWSGLDTADQRRRYDQTSSDADFELGQQKQTRTNVLLGVTAGFAVLTVGALLFTDFDAPLLGRASHTRIFVANGIAGIDGVF
jgi:hypothetical protein